MDLQQLKTLGFDLSRHIPFTNQFKVRCSQCESLVIYGVPTHETGCPHSKSECKGCNEIVPKNQEYCQDCLI